MRRQRVAAELRLAFAILTACLLACAPLVIPTAAHADEPASHFTKTAKNPATVGMRTANAKGGDSRGVFNYEILPRGLVQDWVAISNFRRKPITVRVFAKDASSTRDSAFAIQASADAPKDVGSWITLKENKVTIPARTEVVVPFQLGVPYNATPGDHAGGIVVSLLAKEAKPQGGTIVVDHRIAMRVHLRVPGDLKPALSIERLKVSWNGGVALLGRGDVSVSYAIRNTGNVRMTATGDVKLTRLLGLPAVDAAAPPVDDLLPGGVAGYRTVVKNVSGTGPMQAKISLRGVPKDAALNTKVVNVIKVTSFQAWPGMLLAIVVALLLAGATGGRYERHRRKRIAAEKADSEAVDEKARENAKHRILVRSTLAVLAPMITLGSLLVPALVGPANAAGGDQWKATISKKQGVAIEPFDIQTSGGCPMPATAMVGFGFGRGFPKTGAVVVSNTEGNVTNGSGFTAALLDSMKNIMAMQPDPRGLAGEYKFVIRCIKPEFPDKSYGEYVAAVRFDSLNHWVSLPPLTDKKGPIVAIPTSGKNGEPAESPKASGSASPEKKSPGATAKGATGKDAAGKDAQDSGADSSSRDAEALRTGAETDSGGSGTTWLTLGLGAAALIGFFVLAFGRRLPGPWQRS